MLCDEYQGWACALPPPSDHGTSISVGAPVPAARARQTPYQRHYPPWPAPGTRDRFADPGRGWQHVSRAEFNWLFPAQNQKPRTAQSVTACATPWWPILPTFCPTDDQGPDRQYRPIRPLSCYFMSSPDGMNLRPLGYEPSPKSHARCGSLTNWRPSTTRSEPPALASRVLARQTCSSPRPAGLGRPVTEGRFMRLAAVVGRPERLSDDGQMIFEVARCDPIVALTCSYVSPLTESNRRPSPYHGDALPTELRGRVFSCPSRASAPPGAPLRSCTPVYGSSAPGVRELTVLHGSWRPQL
jgi:hypothetical protein